MSTFVNASTSVVLVPSSNGPQIVYFPPISTIGRLITVRDVNGFISTGNYITLSTIDGAGFGSNASGVNTVQITQPYGFITLDVQNDASYAIVNTFAFPAGSTAAFVSNVTVSTLNVQNNIRIRDIGNGNTQTIFSSTNYLYYNNTEIGDVTSTELISTTIGLEAYASNVAQSRLLRRTIAVGYTSNTVSNINTPAGTIIYSDNNYPWNTASCSGTGGFSNGGVDVVYGAGSATWVAAGNNQGNTNSSNTGFLQWSQDGSYWVNSTSPVLSIAQGRTRVFWANNLFHAVGSNTNGGTSTIMHSVDGKTWNSSATTPTIPFVNPSGVGYGTGIAFGCNVWVATGVQANTINYSLLYSLTGSNWSPATSVNWGASGLAYDVAFNGERFLAFVQKDLAPLRNIAYSGNGTDWFLIPSTGNVDFNNEPGFIAAPTTMLALAVSQTYRRFSVDGGLTWLDFTGLPAGAPSRPYWDGSTWWISINTGTDAQSIWYSFTGSNNWSNWLDMGGFSNKGYARGFYSQFSMSNLNLQLISTVSGLSSNFRTLNLVASTLTFTGDVKILAASNSIAIGNGAGQSQTGSAIAIGLGAGQTSQGTAAIALGHGAGLTSQTQNATAIGFFAGQTSQQEAAIAIGFQAGNVGQNLLATSIGYQAGQTSQSTNAIAIGVQAGQTLQGARSIAIGPGSGNSSQGNSGIAIGDLAATNGQGIAAIAIGSNAGYTSQAALAIAIGQEAGYSNQLGIAIGRYAGRNDQKSLAIAIGTTAGSNNQEANSVAIGVGAGYSNQGVSAVALGVFAGSNTQGNYGIAIGETAGYIGQKSQAVAIGQSAGFSNQSNSAIAIGLAAGSNTQGQYSIAIGQGAGFSAQSNYAIAIGYFAGQDNQGSNTIAIGNQAGTVSQSNNTIILNAQGSALNATSANSFYVAPVRNDATSGNVLYYNTTTKEVSYGAFGGTATYATYAGTSSNLFTDSNYTVNNIFTNANNIRLGNAAGEVGQGVTGIAIGQEAGRINQQGAAVAVGFFAGRSGQCNSAVAVGNEAGLSNQNQYAIAIGFQSGRSNQKEGALAIGNGAGTEGQGYAGIAIGFGTAQITQNDYGVAIGRAAGYSGQGAYGIALGYFAGSNAQGQNAIAIGNAAGQVFQSNNAIAIGASAGATNQHTNSIVLNAQGTALNTSNTDAFYVAPVRNDATPANVLYYNTTTKEITYGAGGGGGGGTYATYAGTASNLFTNSNYTVQNIFTNASAVRLCTNAGLSGQASDGIAIGSFCATTNQQSGGVAIGTSAAFTGQGQGSVAIGQGAAGSVASQQFTVAIGANSGERGQQTNSIAVGYAAGSNGQGIGAVAIGLQAAQNSQSNYSVAIGAYAARPVAASNSVVINGTGADLSGPYGGLFIKPVNTSSGGGGPPAGFNYTLYYNNTSGEFWGYNDPSDSNLKENFTEIFNCFEKVLQLRPVSFTYKEGSNKDIDHGFIAQEVLPLFPNVVRFNEHTSTYSLNYDKFTPMLTLAVQSLHSTNQGLQSTIQLQQQQLARILSTLNLA
jgi:hypothetical protein